MRTDLPALIAAKPPKPPSFDQGILTSWDAVTLANTVNLRGAKIDNIAVLPGVDALSLAAGDVVMLIGLNGSWFLMGRIDVPPLTEPVRIQGGTVIVEGGGGISVRDGGDVTVAAGGEVRSSNFDGNTADDDPGTQGWALGSGRLALEGLFIPAIQFLSDDSFTNNFQITTTSQALGTLTVNVPSWANQAAVMTMVGFSFQNTTAVNDAVVCEPVIHTDLTAISVSRGVVAGDTDSLFIGHTSIVDTSSLASFDIEGFMRTELNPWPADPSNGVAITAMVSFSSEPV